MTDSKPSSDQDLVQRMKAGEEEAFIEIYRSRQSAIHRFALQMSGSPSVAEDVTQEVFLEFMRDADNYDPARGSLSSYLYGMARNIVFDHLKQGRPDLMIVQPEGDAVSRLAAPGDPLSDLTRAEALDRLRREVLALPPHYREVLVLCELNEMNYAGAAEALGCAVGTVRSRLHRAREMLLKKLSARNAAGERVDNLKAARCVL
jgi:RNA polymerase sigma-70 factor (ECF subfamily)